MVRFWAIAAAVILFAGAARAAAPPAGIRLPGKSYVDNGGFERGEEGWQYFASRRYGGVVEDRPHAGKACFRATGVIDDYCYFQQASVPLTPGQTYTLSAWMRCAGFRRAGPESQVLNLANYGWTQSASLGPKTPDEDWTHYWTTFQAPPTQEQGGRPSYTLVIFWPVKSEGTVWVDDIQIEEGDRATDYTDRYLGWAFQARDALGAACRRAEDARAILRAEFGAFPIAKALSAKADGILAGAGELAGHLGAFDTLTAEQAQALPKEAERLREEAASLKTLVFLGNPCVPLPEVRLPDSVPAELAVAWTCFAGEERAIALNIANLTPRAGSARLAPGELFDATRNVRVVGVPWVTAHSVPEIRGHLKQETLFTDPLPRLDEAGQVFLGNGRLSQVVLRIDTAGLLPGEYRGAVALASLADAGDRREIDIRLRVLPVRLAAIEGPCVSDVSAMDEYALASSRPMGINTFALPAQWLVPDYNATGSGPLRVDLTRLAPRVRRCLRQCPEARFLFTYGAGAVVGDHLTRAYGLKPGSPRFRALATGWVKAVVAAFGRLGVGPERLVFETVDEPGHGQIDEAIRWAGLIKAAAPRAQTHTYVTSFQPNDERLAQLYRSHDIIAPGFTCINDECVSALRKLGKKVWVYDCQNSGETFHPIAYYRLLPWLAWRHKLDGWGHFSWLTTERGRGYTPWEGVAEESVVYPGAAGGAVVSRRWLALVAGTQDYRALRALERLAAAAERAGAASEIAVRARALLRRLPDEALALLKPGREYFTGLAPGADPDTLDRFREEIAACAADLARPLVARASPLQASLAQGPAGTSVALHLRQPARVAARFLCNASLPWRTASAALPAGRRTLRLPCGPGERVTRCLVEATDGDGLVRVASALPLPSVSVDSSVPPYDPNRLNDGLATPGMKFEPEHGWISGGAATEHWVVAALERPTPIRGVRLWWMTFYGLPQGYKVQVWRGGAWQDAPGFGGWRAAGGAVEEVRFVAPVATEKVRVLQKPGGGNKGFPNLMGLSEVELF